MYHMYVLRTKVCVCIIHIICSSILAVVTGMYCCTSTYVHVICTYHMYVLCTYIHKTKGYREDSKYYNSSSRDSDETRVQ